MKGPLSADRLYFISALVFAIDFILNSILNYAWPLPADVTTQIPATANAINSLSWVLAIAGLLTFILGLLVSRK